MAEEPNDEALMTEYSEHLTMTNTENGRKSYVFTAPLVEGYSLAKEPYQEFRKPFLVCISNLPSSTVTTMPPASITSPTLK